MRQQDGARAQQQKNTMVDYSKWDKFEDSDDERIAEDLRRVSKQPETLEQRQQAKESARRIARAFMSQEDETTGPNEGDDPANQDVAKRRNDAWCKWVADHKDANDAAYAAFEAKDPDAWKRVPYTTLMKNGVGTGVAYPFDAEWFKSEPTADEKPPDIDPGFLDGCFDEIDPSSVERIVYSGPGEWHGKLVTPAEARLLDCFAIDKAEAAEKERQAREKKGTSKDERERQQAALQAAKRKADLREREKPKELKVLDKPVERASMPPQTFDGGAAVVAAAAEAARNADEPNRPVGTQRATASAAVPKRAKRSREDNVVQDPRFVVDEDAWETRDVAKLIKSEALPFDAATSDEEYLEVPLPNFPENDTLILHVSVAADVDIWAMNLCPGDHDDGASILYHFNPRRRERGGRLVENDKSEDDWGRAVKTQLPPKPALFGLAKAEVALRVVRRAGHVDVHVTVNRQQATAWRLRSEVSEGALALLVPTRDDFGNRQGVVVHDAWWGALPLLPAHRPYRERGPAY